MILRKMVRVLSMISLVALLFGCRKSPANGAATTTNAPALPQAPPMETILRIHWLGRKNISTDTNAAMLMRVWNLPESAKLQAQTLDKLSLAPWRFLRGETNSSSARLMRPLLDDLADEESYVEIRRAAGSTNAADEMVLAVHLNNQRAALWQTNLAAVMESLTGIPQVSSQPSNTNYSAHWSLKKHHSPNLIELARAGDWTIIGAGDEHNALMDEALASVNRTAVAFPTQTTNSWLEVSGDLSRIGSATGIAADVCSNLPYVSFAVLGDPRYILTRGEIILPGNKSAKLDPWNIPTNLIDGNLASFTAVRGFGPWLAASGLWTNLQIGPPPDQFYVWALNAFPMETYFAAPLSDASNTVSRITDLVLEKGSPRFTTNGLDVFRRSATYNGLSWGGVPYLEPFLRAIETNGSSFVFGGCFQRVSPAEPPSPLLLNEIRGHTNLVYYDWEMTGPRIEQWIYVGQFVRLVSGKAQLSPGSAGLKWLKAVIPQMGNCATEITQTSPGQLSFTRNSTVGLTAIELQLLADWLESPDFPCGLHTVSAPASEQPKTP